MHIYISLNSLSMRNVSDKSSRENQNTSVIYNTFFPIIVLFMEYVKKYGRDRQAVDGSILRRIRFACSITKATDTHSECVIRTDFSGNDGYANTPQCYIYPYTACLVNYMSTSALTIIN